MDSFNWKREEVTIINSSLERLSEVKTSTCLNLVTYHSSCVLWLCSVWGGGGEQVLELPLINTAERADSRPVCHWTTCRQVIATVLLLSQVLVQWVVYLVQFRLKLQEGRSVERERKRTNSSLLKGHAKAYYILKAYSSMRTSLESSL